MKTASALCLGFVLAACNASSAAPPTSPAPSRACTQLGCKSGLDLELVRSTPWPQGTYRITLRVDDKSASCEGKLPLGSCESGPSFRCSDPSLTISESGCALPPDQHALSGLASTATAASKVSLVIEHQGSIQATAQLTPTFQSLQPNGAGCEPVCETASMKLNLR
jgi:hypothetical protein